MIDYYLQNCSGLLTTQVAEKDPGFYKVLARKKWLDILPGKHVKHRQHRRWKEKGRQDMLLFYLRHYHGKYDSKVQTIDNGFYTTLKNRKWLDLIPSYGSPEYLCSVAFSEFMDIVEAIEKSFVQ
jgi:hypothetical protein